MKATKNIIFLLIWVNLLICVPHVLAQPKEATNTEDSNEFGPGGKVTTTYKDLENGGQVVEKIYTDAKKVVRKKEVETFTEKGKTTETDEYDAAGTQTHKTKSEVDKSGKTLSAQIEHYKDGVLNSGFVYGYDNGRYQLLKELNPKTGIFEELTAEQKAAKAEKDKAAFEQTLHKMILKMYKEMADEALEKPKKTNLPGFDVGFNPYHGINSYGFSTPAGRVEVNLPNLMSPGDQVTATLEITPKGKTKEEIEKNEKELAEFKLQLPDDTLINLVAETPFSFVVPRSATSQNCHLSLVRKNKPMVTSLVPIHSTPLPETEFSLPSGGQQGKYLVLTGDFNGIFENTDSVKIGESPLKPVAETPYARIVLNTSNSIGVNEISLNESGRTAKCSFRNIGLKMTAGKLDLLRGQTAGFQVQVLGLSGITEDLPLTIVNNSPAIVAVSGGNSQLIIISPGMVNADGTFQVSQTLTGVVPGSFSITGTVTWTDNCSNDEAETGPKDRRDGERNADPPATAGTKEAVEYFIRDYFSGADLADYYGSLIESDPKLAKLVEVWAKARKAYLEQKQKAYKAKLEAEKQQKKANFAKDVEDWVKKGKYKIPEGKTVPQLEKEAADAQKAADEAKKKAIVEIDKEKAEEKILKETEEKVDKPIREKFLQAEEKAKEKAKQEKETLDKKPN